MTKRLIAYEVMIAYKSGPETEVYFFESDKEAKMFGKKDKDVVKIDRRDLNGSYRVYTKKGA